jgi:hypothetical protein
MIYPLLSGKLLQFAIENGTLEIVDLPNLKMVDLSSSRTVNVYQRLFNFIPMEDLVMVMGFPFYLYQKQLGFMTGWW